MPKLTIDGIEIEVAPGTSVLQACEQLGIEIPRFCYHDRLSVPANCRMCLVEMEGSPKPIASCALPAADNMKIKTDSEVTKKARKGVMEMLLINHPLDCPICDQGGECDLQDQAMAYGFDRGRFTEGKRAVAEKYMGPLIKTFMTRCIHCTRCVRFADEIAGVAELGTLGRGENLEIGTYVEEAVKSELSGNLVDVCPVGALTSKPYAFTARPWELKKTDTIDVMDAVGSNIRVDARGREVLRVLPRLHEDVNEEWIADKTRHANDGLKRQRLDRPYVRVNGKLRAASWNEAFAVVADKLKNTAGEKIAAIAGDLCDVESMFALKQLMSALGSPNLDCRQDGAQFDVSNRAGYIFNPGIAGIEQADVILLVGANPRWEAPMVNARIRKRWLKGGLTVAAVGPQFPLTFPVTTLGGGPAALSTLIDGQGAFADVLKNAKNPIVIAGQGAFIREDGMAVHAALKTLCEKYGVVREGWNGFAMLHTAAARVGALDVGFTPAQGGRDFRGILEGAKSSAVEVVYLLGADEFDTSQLGRAFVIYQGHHGDRGAHRADVILPGAAYVEKDGIYVNTEGRVQYAKRAVYPLGDAREDWKIVRALSALVGGTLPYDTQTALRVALKKAHPHFAQEDTLVPSAWGSFVASGPMKDQPFVSPIANYYMTDPISRASETMAQCTSEFLGSAQGRDQNRTGTDG
jgi:NADH-quinone oxidoreductase subunit G